MDRAFRRVVLERLKMLDGIGAHAGSALPVPVARTQIRWITEGWRELLTEHQPDAAGRCPVCSGWWRRRKWPCRVWATAQHQLIGDTSDERHPTRDMPQRRPTPGSSFSRPREVEIIDRRTGGAPNPTRVDSAARRAVTSATRETVQIHRAAVIERYPMIPRPRRARHPRG